MNEPQMLESYMYQCTQRDRKLAQKYLLSKHKILRSDINVITDQRDIETLKESPTPKQAHHGENRYECNQSENKAVKRYVLKPHKHCHYE